MGMFACESPCQCSGCGCCRYCCFRFCCCCCCCRCCLCLALLWYLECTSFQIVAHVFQMIRLGWLRCIVQYSKLWLFLRLLLVLALVLTTLSAHRETKNNH